MPHRATHLCGAITCARDKNCSVENALLTALPQEGLHALDARRRVAALAVPLELVHVLTENVPGAESADEVVELGLVLPIAPAAQEIPLF